MSNHDTHQRRSDYFYELPAELIAQTPCERRSDSRLLHVGAQGQLQDTAIAQLPQLLRKGDLVVFNDTRVIPARMFGHKATGGRVEILVERLVGERELWAQLGVSKAPRAGMIIQLDGDPASFEMLGREDDLFHLRLLTEEPLMAVLERAGRLPLPPYIEHAPDAADAARYQTLFARRPGAVAAPTAGLHFDESLIAALQAAGVETALLTLHVGAGTFQPVRVEDLSRHRMHAERYELDRALCDAVARARDRGGRVVSIGTTVARALESAAAAEIAENPARAQDRYLRLSPRRADTRLFITPGYRFRMVDLLLTNFHLPESTLLMLVCAFAGYEPVMTAYRHAVDASYRFFSYGDAMLLTRSATA